MPSKRDRIRREQANHPSAQAALETIKQDPHSLSVLTSISTNKRKRPAHKPATNPSPTQPTKKAKPTPNKDAPKATSSKSALIPRGPRQKATINQPDPSLLRMICDCSSTHRVTELHFRKIPHSMIDWTSAAHISKINAWRNQIYGRAGLKARSVSLWYEQEELWFELYFRLSIKEARKAGRGILLPGAKGVREVFNKCFVGTVIRDRAGDELPPRVEREANAFASKFNRMFPVLRARLNACVFGMSGDVFIPQMTLGMMERYRVMKADMKAKGIECESEYADHLEDWQHFLSHLPESEDVEVRGVIKEEEDGKEMKAKEVDAVAALISLSHSSVDSQSALSTAVRTSYTTDTTNEQTTPELTRSTRTSFSQHSESPYTPPQPVGLFESRVYKPDGIYGCKHNILSVCIFNTEENAN
ncbi:hypothetical protein G6011_05824 [Alternaria panax]|uniref:Uncharacterized protein n=1 Tax=Alternaria panax TaxID=48097 RepID=A0AAD4FHS6_9PLEO|nr:hypothetical protein G6011_05824 [Alternaria panax]